MSGRVVIDGGVDRPCPIVIEAGALTTPTLAEEVAKALGKPPRTLLAVLDDGIPEATRAAALAALGVGASMTITPSEVDKSLATLERLLEACCEAGLNRDEPVVAIGGGIVGDVAGFCAASFQRGVPVVQCPTTLLAMVDASVGGKTGVNLRGPDGALLKNMAGAFHQPHLVLIDPAVLASLEPRVYASGLAECVKHSLLAADAGDPHLFEWLEDHAGAIADRDQAVLSELIARNVRVKVAIVRGDEREQAAAGGRALLNLGHTFAHAIEPLPMLSPTGSEVDAPLQHGEAVALGVVAACHAAKLPETPRVEALLRRFGLPTRVVGMPPIESLIERMGHDKKSRSGVLRIVLPEALGRCVVVASPTRGVLERGWASIARG